MFVVGKLTSPLAMFNPRYMSPKEPLPIFRTKRYFPLTKNSDFDEDVAEVAVFDIFLTNWKDRFLKIQSQTFEFLFYNLYFITFLQINSFVSFDSFNHLWPF